jgi:hypothetical protein
MAMELQIFGLLLIIDVTVEKVWQWQTVALKINKNGKRYTKALPS